MNYSLLFIKSFLIIIGLSLLYKKIFNVNIGKIIPISFITIGLVLFIFGIVFNNLMIGNIVLYILSLLGFALYVYSIILKKEKIHLSLGLISYLIISILFFVYCYKYRFCMWDEFSHWGPMVRTMVENNSLYINYPRIGGAHIEYPPLIPLIEYFFCTLYGSYSEAVCACAIHIFEFSLFIPYIFDAFKDRKLINKALLSVLIVFCILTLDVYTLFRTIYVDLAIPLIAVYSFLIIIDNENEQFKTIAFIFSLTATLLSKDIGIALFLCSVFYYLCVSITKKEISFNKKDIFKICAIILIPICFLLVWNVYSSSRIDLSTTQFSITSLVSNINLMNISATQSEIISKIFNYLLNDSIIKGGIVRISFISYFIIMVAAIATYMYLSSNHKNGINYLLLFVIANVGYIILLIVLYCYCFSEGEALGLNSFERYLFSMNVYCILTFILFLFSNAKIDNFYMLIVIILMISKDTLFVCPPVMFTKQEVITNEDTQISEYINYYFADDQKIIVYSNDFMKTLKLRYLTEFKCNYLWIDVREKKPLNKSDLDSYDYVLFSCDDVNYETLNNYFGIYVNTDGIYNDILYKITFENNELKLIMMS